MSTRLLLAAIAVLGACAKPPPPAAPCPPPPAASSASDLVITTSAHDHATTVAKAVAAIEARGLALVQRVDHSATAQAAGLALDPTTVLVFGNPKVGTPLMQAAPTIALDLPLRLLVWQRDAKIQVAYHAPLAVAAAHGAREHPAATKMTEVLAAIAAAATTAP
jgi:uncharacterized protein (DUF302 family)